MKWWFSSPRPEVKVDKADLAYNRAMQLSDEVIAKIRERAQSPNPFRAALAEMLLRPGRLNPILIADAFEARQEARIFRGPPNGRG